MITIIRKNQRWLLLVVAFITIIAFGWFYTTRPTEGGTNEVAKMYGRTLFRSDVDRELKTYRLALGLGMTPLVAELTRTAQSEEAAMTDFVLNLNILRHEAERLWIEPTDKQIADAIRGLPALQGPNGFDSNKYNQLLQTAFAPQGLTELHLQNMVRDYLKLMKVRELVVSPAKVNDADVKAAFRGAQKISLTVARLPIASLKEAPAAPSEEQIKTFYEEHKAELIAPEQRSVTVAEFALSDTDSKLEGKALMDAMQQLANRVSTFSDSVETKSNEDFSAVAEKAHAKVWTTEYFSAGGASDLPTQIAGTAFVLNEIGAIGPIRQEGSKFYVLQLAGIKEPRDLTLEEAQPQIVTTLEAQAKSEAFTALALKADGELREKLKANENFSAAAKAAGWEVTTVSEYEPTSATTLDDNIVYAQAAMILNEGETSRLERAPWGVFVVHVDKLFDLDPTFLNEKKAEVKTSLQENREGLLFTEWLQNAREKADVKLIGNPS
ncbi:MAG: peptidyl-prolyl cis-trans isomerase [Chthoniobacterales bacterium]